MQECSNVKDRKTYKVLTYCSAFFPINRIYLGEKVGARWWTFNLLFIGWVIDMFYMDKRFDEAMNKRGFTNTDIRNLKGK